MRIDVLMTCHNRRATTLSCLDSLHAQALPSGLNLDIWLVDDASTDGTAEAVSAAYPAVHILRGDGSLYWCGGMRLAWASAVEAGPDFLFLLNDDVVLNSSALAALLDTWRAGTRLASNGVIVVGSFCDPVTGEHAYGGQRRKGRHPGRVAAIVPGKETRECDTFQGNAVLIPRAVYEHVGGFRPFTHAMADTDYGYRARGLGCRILIAPGYQGTCIRNLIRVGRTGEGGTGLRERLRIACGPKGLPPRDWVLFLRSHSGWEWPLYWIWPYLRVAFGR